MERAIVETIAQTRDRLTAAQCRLCLFAISLPNPDQYECRRNPLSAADSQFPEVEGAWWCGEFIKRDAPAAENWFDAFATLLLNMKGIKGDKGDKGDVGDPGLVVQSTLDVPAVGNGIFVDTGLVVPMAADAAYLVEAFLLFRSAAGGTGIAFGLNGPPAPALVVGITNIPNNLTAAVQRAFRSYNAGAGSAGVDAPNADLLGTLTALVRNGPTAGDLAIRFAPAGGAQVTVRAGSLVRYRAL